MLTQRRSYFGRYLDYHRGGNESGKLERKFIDNYMSLISSFKF